MYNGISFHLVSFLPCLFSQHPERLWHNYSQWGKDLQWWYEKSSAEGNFTVAIWGIFIKVKQLLYSSATYGSVSAGCIHLWSDIRHPRKHTHATCQSLPRRIWANAASFVVRDKVAIQFLWLQTDVWLCQMFRKVDRASVSDTTVSLNLSFSPSHE